LKGDQLINSGNNVYYKTGNIGGIDVFTVEWRDIDGLGSGLNYQVQLFKNGTIFFNYGTATSFSGGGAGIGLIFSDGSFLGTNSFGYNPVFTNSNSSVTISSLWNANLQYTFTPNNNLPTFANSGSITICQNGSYFLAPSTANGTFSSSDPTVATVNSSGYVTAVSSSGNTDISLTTIDGTVTATVTVGTTSSLTITDPTAKPNYKFIINTPQGPVDTNNGVLNYVGYNGFIYSSQTRPTNTGFYRASRQVGNEAGCPVQFYIIKCDSCQ
jgi:hypothetical protein